MRRGVMSKPGDTVTLRNANPDEHEALEALQWRASFELREYRDQLMEHPDAIHLPPSQIANGQVIVAELDGKIAGFAAVVGGELDGLFVEPDLWGRGIGRVLATPRFTRPAIAAWRSRSLLRRARGSSTKAADFQSRARRRRASGRRSGCRASP